MNIKYLGRYIKECQEAGVEPTLSGLADWYQRIED